MNLRMTDPPDVEPVSVAEAKEHCKIEHALEDGYVASLVKAATGAAESFLNRALITQKWEMSFDCFPASPIEILKPPLQSVDSIKYIDVNGVEQTLAPSEYEVDTGGETGRVALREGKSWPSTKTTLNAVKIAFTAGYGSAGTDVPEQIRQGIKLIVGELYERRENAIVGAPIETVPLSSHYLFWPLRVIRF